MGLSPGLSFTSCVRLSKWIGEVEEREMQRGDDEVVMAW